MSNPRYLTNDEKNIILRKYDEGLNTYEIAEILKRSPTSVQRFLKKQGYSLKKNGYKRRKQKYTLNLTKFQTNSEFSDYWAGFIAADGCIYKGSGQKRVIINIAIKDKNHLEKFDVGYPVRITKRNSVVIDIPSDILAENLESKYNITESKTKTLKYPNLENHSHFIRGYFDGDGGFHLKEGKYLSAYIIGTESFLTKLAEHLPCKVSIYPIKGTYMHTLEISRKPVEMKLFIDFLYKDSSIYLERKQVLTKYAR